MPLHVSAAVSQAGADVVAWGCMLLLLLLLLLLPPGSGERGKISSTDRSFTLDRSLLSRFVSARSRVATTLAAKKGLGQDSPSSLVRMCSTKSTLKRRRRGSASRVRESTTYLQLKSSM